MLNFIKTESKKQISKNLKIQIENNRILRENFRKEQQLNKNLNLENKVLKEKIEELKNNVRILSKDNNDLATLLNEIIVKYNVKLSDGSKPKAKKSTKKKGE